MAKLKGLIEGEINALRKLVEEETLSPEIAAPKLAVLQLQLDAFEKNKSN